MYDPVRRQPPALQPGCKNFPLYLPPETDIVSPPLPHRRTRQKGAVFGKIDDGWKIFRTFAALRENRTMKIREEYKVREMAGEHVVIMQGRLGVDMTKIISLNESALYLWNALAGKEFSVDDATPAHRTVRGRRRDRRTRRRGVGRKTPRLQTDLT